MDTIGDYYDRIEQQRREAYQKWQAAKKKHAETGEYDDLVQERKAYEDMIDAGNTGD